MAEFLRYVNRSSSAGGDGTTNNTAGATRAFATLADALSAAAGYSPSAGDTLRIVCEGASADAAASISGISNNFTLITVETDPNASAGRWGGAGVPYNTGKYRIEDSSSGYCLDIQEDFVTLKGFQLKETCSSGITALGIQIRNITAGNGNSLLTIHRMLIRGVLSGTADGQAIYPSSTDISIKCTSSLIYDWVRGSSACYGLLSTGGGTIRFHKVTLANMWRALRSCNAKDCIGQGADTGSVFLGMTMDHCASNDGTASGTGSRTNQTFTFVDEANDDYHLSTSDTGAYGFGQDLSGDANLPVSEDWDGETMATSHDMGGDWAHGGGGGGTAVPVFTEYYKRRRAA